jgi:small subunit ribosomal protein S8
MVTDPIASMLVSIKNAQAAGRSLVVMPHSKLKESVARTLCKNGYLDSVTAKKNKSFDELHLTLGESKIINLRRVSKPGRRLYATAKSIPRPMGGAGMMILSTSQGIITDREARRKGVGGEMICEVY